VWHDLTRDRAWLAAEAGLGAGDIETWTTTAALEDLLTLRFDATAALLEANLVQRGVKPAEPLGFVAEAWAAGALMPTPALPLPSVLAAWARDPPGAPVHRLAARAAAAALTVRLRSRFGACWWRHPEAGPWLQKAAAAQLAEEPTGPEATPPRTSASATLGDVSPTPREAEPTPPDGASPAPGAEASTPPDATSTPPADAVPATPDGASPEQGQREEGGPRGDTPSPAATDNATPAATPDGVPAAAPDASDAPAPGTPRRDGPLGPLLRRIAEALTATARMPSCDEPPP
jgi:hypothetical protein